MSRRFFFAVAVAPLAARIAGKSALKPQYSDSGMGNVCGVYYAGDMYMDLVGEPGNLKVYNGARWIPVAEFTGELPWLPNHPRGWPIARS